ncbi:MAG: phosphoribosylformylglycinamidine cyclo-ligase [Chloroflexi bacterium]|nr:phosphoribosylformylglycinamidine cyclo-ligase [Chloroflexota bacterium]
MPDVAEPQQSLPGGDAYRGAGVDVDLKAAVNDMLRERLEHQSAALLAGAGAFSGLALLPQLREPVLGATVDSVGTKLKLATALNRHADTARDIVHHCVNDLLCSGLEPFAFLDYLAMPRLDPEVIAAVIDGLRRACGAAGCLLLGGETPELPEVYAPGDYELAGIMIGVGERYQLFDRSHVQPGDIVLGLPSAGLHTNGYTLARKLIPPEEWQTYSPRLGTTYGDALLAEHRSYLAEVRRLRSDVPVRGLAHITGGGLIENLPRCLPDGLGMRISLDAWQLPPVFQELRERSSLSDVQLARTFNSGIGLAVVLPSASVSRALAVAPEAIAIGEVVRVPDGQRVQLEGRFV